VLWAGVRASCDTATEYVGGGLSVDRIKELLCNEVHYTLNSRMH
jgi:hypothetical protein